MGDGNANLEAVEAVNFQGRESARPFWGGWGGWAGAVMVVVGGGRLLAGSSPAEGVWSRQEDYGGDPVSLRVGG